MNKLRESKTAKAVAGFVGLVTAVMMMGPVVASADAVSDLQAQIAALMAQINALNAQVATAGGSASCAYTFATNLKQGQTGTDVMNLQKVLNMSADTQVSASGAGSPGNETSYFGSATKAAVVKFQNKNASAILTPIGLTSGTGFVGAATREKLNAMCTTTGGTTGGTTTGGTTTTTGGALTVSAASQPANSLAPTSASRVAFTKFMVTAGASDVTITGVNVERSGLAQDAVFSGVVLLDEDGTQIGIAKTLGSNHQAVVGDTFTVKAGTSKTLTVAGNMASSLTAYAGQVAGITVTGVNTSSTVSGSFPITGAMHTINASLTLGTATVGTATSVTGISTTTQPIGTTGQTFSAIRVTAGSAEDITIKSVRWNQSGSAGSGDLSNVTIYVDGTAYPTTVSSDGKYYSANFGSGVSVAKGEGKDISIKADVTGSGSASRTVKFDIYKNTDLYVMGNTYGYGITPSGLGTANPAYYGSTMTISAGSVTSIAKATSVAAQNIAINVSNQPLGGFVSDIKGEPISVQSTVFTIASSSGTGYGLLTSVSLYDENGAVVAGPVDATYTSALVQTVTFTDTVTFPVGVKTYTLKGKVPSTIGNNTVYTTTVAVASWSSITGQTTGNSISLGVSNFTMNPMTVKSGALAITASTNPAAQSIIAGSTGVTFSNIQFDTTLSGEDVQFSSVTLKGGGSASTTPLTACQLFDGATALNTGSNIVNPTIAASTSVAFTFDSALTVPKGTIKTLAVKCNVPASITDTATTFTWGMTVSSTNPSVTGKTSASSVTATGGTVTGQTMTIGTSSFAGSLDASSPSYKIAAAGSTGVIAGAIKMRATNDAINLTKLGLTLTGSASSSPADLTQVSIWDGGTQVGTATFTGSNTTATSTLAITLPKDTDKTLTIKVDIANIGTSDPAVEGHLIKVDYLNAEGTGVGSGTTVYGTGSTAVSGVRIFESFPTFALDTVPSTGVADGILMKFKVTANSTGPIGLDQFKFTIATSTITSVTAINMFGYTDSGYSNGISGVGTGGQVAASNTTAPAGTFTITPSGIIQVPTGTTYYFKVTGTVAGTQTGSSVTTTLLGDSAYPGLATKMMTTATALLSGNNLVWSPNATSTAVASDDDWTNSYGVAGLPSSGISQSRGL